MKKKIMGFILAVSMLVMMFPVFSLAEAATVAASVNGTNYQTLDAAVSAANAGDTVKLESNITLTAGIDISKSITLDLNAKEITTGGYTITVNSGDLTVNGNGKMTNAIDYKDKNNAYQLFLVNSGASLTIVNGTYETKSVEIIKTFGTATVKDGTFICNGTKVPDEGKCIMVAQGTTAKLTVEAGTLTAVAGTDFCGMNGVYAASGATIVLGKTDGTGPSVTTDYNPIGGNNNTSPASITIYGGTYTADADANRTPGGSEKLDSVVYAPYGGTLTIYGGTFDSTSGKVSHALSLPYSTVNLTVNVYGGNFESAGSNIYYGAVSGLTDGRKLTISGGYFTSNPSDYLASGKVAVVSDKDGYAYMVDTAVADNVKVVAGDTTVTEINTDSLTGTAKQDAETANDMAATVTTGTGDTGLTATAGNVAKNTNITDAAAREALGNKASANDTVTIVIQPKLSVKAVSYDSEKKLLTLDIKAVYDTIATTNPDNMTDANSTKIGETKDLDVKAGTPVKITYQIPTEMAVYNNETSKYDPLTIKHIKEDGTVYYYTGTVTDEVGGAFVTFTVMHGFSDFTAMAYNTGKLTVTFDTDKNNPVTYDITSVNNVNFPDAPAKSGYTFTGYSFEGVSGTYTTMTEALWNSLMTGETGTKSVKATAQYTSTGNNTGKVPKTGDTQPVALFAMSAVLGISATAILYRKKRDI